MNCRRILGIALIAAFTGLLLECANNKLLSISVAPTAVTTSVGQTTQFRATGSYVRQSEQRTYQPYPQDITNQVTWTSSNTAVATIDSTGLAKLVGTGSTTITASKDGASATAALSAGGPGGVGSLGLLTAIQIIPSSQTTLVLGENAQFLAVGTMSNPDGSTTTQDITNLVKWVSSDLSVATINNSGLATAVGAGGGSASITALGTASDGSVIVGTAGFTGCPTGCGPVTLPVLSVYEVGLGTGSVQGFDSANPSVIVINCDPSTGNTAGCTGYFPLGSTVVLTATPGANSTFGGWSANCTPIRSNTCSVTIPANAPSVPIGAIFN